MQSLKANDIMDLLNLGRRGGFKDPPPPLSSNIQEPRSIRLNSPAGIGFYATIIVNVYQSKVDFSPNLFQRLFLNEKKGIGFLKLMFWAIFWGFCEEKGEKTSEMFQGI